jgi:DNA replicative helicase MCM subunit Mcm2 (Cdc46/Mcm family)
VQNFVHARLHNLPYHLDGFSLSPAVSSIGAGHEGRLLTVGGSVVRAQGVQLIEAYHTLECVKCKALVRVPVSISDPAAEPLSPELCPARGCDSCSFKKSPDSPLCYTNYQEINIQVSQTRILMCFCIEGVSQPCHCIYICLRPPPTSVSVLCFERKAQVVSFVFIGERRGLF